MVDIFAYIEEMKKELQDDILSFWMKNVVDNENGGFYGYISNDNTIDKCSDKGSILNSRILWTFSMAYRLFKKEEYLAISDRAYEYLLNNFWDSEYEGLFWMVDYKGKPVETRKQVYNLAFGIYALSEYYLATKKAESLDKAIVLYKLIEKYAYDKEYKGYIEGLNREWGILTDMRLSEKDMNVKKSMNTHLHIMEAYTNLLRAWPDEELKERQKELIRTTIDKIIDTNTYHFKLFFDEDWTTKTNIISYGHDIEGSWLLYEAAEVLGDKELLNEVKEISLNMAKYVYEQGVDTINSCVYDEAENGEIKNKCKSWWPQAEGMVGFINAYELTNEDKYLKVSYDIWGFVKNCFIDKKHGEWFWSVDEKGDAVLGSPKVEPWKCPYHNSRACYEIITRLEKLKNK